MSGVLAVRWDQGNTVNDICRPEGAQIAHILAVTNDKNQNALPRERKGA